MDKLIPAFIELNLEVQNKFQLISSLVDKFDQKGILSEKKEYLENSSNKIAELIITNFTPILDSINRIRRRGKKRRRKRKTKKMISQIPRKK